MVRKKDYPHAIIALNQMIENNNNDTGLIKLRYQCYYNIADYESAKGDLNRLKTLGEHSAEFYIEYANLLYNTNYVDSAIYYLEEALKLNPKIASANFDLAAIYYQSLSEDSIAIVYVERELLYYPNDLHARLLKTDLLNSLGQYAKAQKEAEEIIKIAPNITEVYSAEGTSWFNMGNCRKAAECYSRAITKDHANADYYKKRANVYVKTDSMQAAINDLNKSIELKPNDINSYALRAYCFKKINQPAKACDDIAHIKKINPTYPIDTLSSGLKCN